MDPSAPVNVGQGTVITSAAAALLASVYATFKAQPMGPLAASTALNSGIASATFFSVREYVVSPILLSTVPSAQYDRRRRALQAFREENVPAPEHLSWWDMRAHKIPDTALSGAFTGGLLNAWKRGRLGVMPGITTGAVICSLLQLAYNEFAVARLKYVSGKLKEPQGSIDTKITSVEPDHTQHNEPLLQRLFGFIGLRQVSDEEYLNRMKRERDGYVRRIAELEEERKT